MVELETEGELTRAEVAAFLRELATEIDDGVLDSDPDRDPVSGEPPADHAREEPVAPKRVTFIVGGDSATVAVPDTVAFEVEVESRSPLLSSGVSQAIELELSWDLEESDAIDDGIELG